jgi:predicted enzyme related to lactoylglutathione lyase
MQLKIPLKIMITSIRHTGIVVREIDKAIKFYQGLGFVINKRVKEKGIFIDNVVGLDNCEIETVKLSSPCGNLIELLKYNSHPIQTKIVNQPSNQLGCSHLALTVKDINKTIEYIIESGGAIVNLPKISPEKSVYVSYCHDPEGVLLEIVEEI